MHATLRWKRCPSGAFGFGLDWAVEGLLFMVGAQNS